ncbi:MAG: zinc-dependent metalloprotease [Syntrophales bacterium LBB04]|nr:zinc-dependent metalloprotease [Syntrophales bacterium LBB04]
MIKWYDLLRFLTAILFLCGFTPSVYGATIDVMIVYDSSAKTWVTGQGGMNAFAVDAVARMNQAAANSNVNLTFRLAHAADIAYTYNSSSGLGTALDNLQSGTGNFSIVHQWRDTYGADLVALLVDTGSAFGTVGVGYLLSTYSGLPDYGFTTTAIRSVNTSHTLTHEIGHNLGCQHSKFQKADPGPNSDLNSYSAGWYFTGTNALKYHTIMAYNSDGYGNSYSEAPLFSTPLLTHRGRSPVTHWMGTMPGISGKPWISWPPTAPPPLPAPIPSPPQTRG